MFTNQDLEAALSALIAALAEADAIARQDNLAYLGYCEPVSQIKRTCNQRTCNRLNKLYRFMLANLASNTGNE